MRVQAEQLKQDGNLYFKKNRLCNGIYILFYNVSKVFGVMFEWVFVFFKPFLINKIVFMVGFEDTFAY